MNGALMKATSRLAIAAAAGLMWGGSSAWAADLGGNCCADLEERVAELEATTARKGNRKLSLTINGQINKMVLWWDDGQSSKTYYGIENRNSSTRLDFMGEAKVTPATKIGFEIMLDNQAASSSGINQWDPDGKNNSGITPFGANSFSGNNADNYFGSARRAIFFVDNDKLGRVSVGHYEMAGAITTIDLGGISAGASASMTLVNGSFLIRGPAGQYYAMAWGNITDHAANQSRQNEVRYDSPIYMGFILSSSIANEGSNWGTMLRYANEFSGFRIAAGVGVEHYGQQTANAGCEIVAPAQPTCATGTGSGPLNLTTNPAPDVTSWGVGLSVMHVPTGLFLQGHYLKELNDGDEPTTIVAINGWQGNNKQGNLDSDQWLIQGGIAKNWLGFGNTSIFGEYSRSSNWGASGGPVAPFGSSYSAAAIPGAVAVNGVTGTSLEMYGFGVTQAVDAAATELYLNARHFSADITCTGAGDGCAGAVGAPSQKLQTEDFWAVIGGARVKF